MLVLLLIFFLSSADLFSDQDPSELRVEIGGRVEDLFSGDHFDDLLKDVPDPMRPPSIVVFYSQEDTKCYSKYLDLDFGKRVETELPARERLMAAKYNMDLHEKRNWFLFMPEMDLPTRFGVSEQECPSIVFVPRKCDGWTKWCFPNENCTSFIEQCTDWLFWNEEDDWVTWTKKLIELEGEPKIATVLSNYQNQGKWIKKRSAITAETHLRNSFLASGMPTYTERGYKILDIPDDIYGRIMKIYERFKHREYPEAWNTFGSSQINYHETITKMVSLDFDPRERNSIAKLLQPHLEEWCQCTLTFNAFFGIREYQKNAWLRTHVDRVDTHTISVTFSLNQWDMSESWPLQAIDHHGNWLKYDHPPKTMLFYESTTVPHGRPWRSTGNHLGCFLHFSPIPAAPYDEKCKNAKIRQGLFRKRVGYRSTPTEEPKNPSFHEMGGLLSAKDLDSHTEQEEEIQMGCTFQNVHDRPLTLFWKQNEYTSFFQATLTPQETTIVYTYEGHEFIWSDKTSIPDGTAAPLAKDGAISRIIKGKNWYASNGKYWNARDGKRIKGEL